MNYGERQPNIKEKEFLENVKEAIEEYKESSELEVKDNALNFLEPMYEKILEKNAEIENLQKEVDKLGGASILKE